MLSALTGRFWAGKDAVLKATVALAKLSPKKMLPKIPQLIERFMRECGREKESVVYSRESVTQLGMLLDSAPSIDAYKIVAPMLMQLIITKGDINIGNLDNKDQDQNKTNSRAAGNGSIIMSKELIEIQRLESIQIPVVSKNHQSERESVQSRIWKAL